jgi:hypothetical protein
LSDTEWATIPSQKQTAQIRQRGQRVVSVESTVDRRNQLNLWILADISVRKSTDCVFGRAGFVRDNVRYRWLIADNDDPPGGGLPKPFVVFVYVKCHSSLATGITKPATALGAPVQADGLRPLEGFSGDSCLAAVMYLQRLLSRQKAVIALRHGIGRIS